MRTTATAVLFCLSCLAVSARPDDAETWFWVKAKEFKDGPTRIVTERLVSEAGIDEWVIDFVVLDGTTGQADRGPNYRFTGATVVDDAGGVYRVSRDVQTPRSLLVSTRPGKKAKTVEVRFGRHPDRPGLKLVIPAATIRTLTAKTSYYHKAKG